MIPDQSTSQTSSPDISIIIPVYNDPKGIRTTLESVINQTHDEYEVLPVDNNSTDYTIEIMREFEREGYSFVRCQEEIDIQGSYATRNTGIQSAKGDILCFLDADMWVDETWVEQMETTMESQNCDYLGCNVEVVSKKDPNFYEAYEQSFSFPVETYLKYKHFAPTCALAVRREVFDEVGLFDEQLESGGDKEFGQRVHRAGFEQCYVDDVTAYHPARDSWDELKSKALRIGRGRAQMRRYHPEVGNYHHPLYPIQFLPPSPFRLRRRFSGQDASLSTLVGFYGLEYVLKLTQTYGTIREWLSLRQADRGEP